MDSTFKYWEHYLFARFNTYFQTGTSMTLSFNYGLKDYIPLQTSQGIGKGRQVYTEYYEMPSVDQLVSSLKLAQSLGMNTSMSIEYLNRLNPGLVAGSVAVMNNENLFTEDELFDDRYGYSGHELSVSFTHYLPAYIKLEMVGNRLWKFYQNRQIYDLEGNLSEIDDTRTDNRTIIWGSLSRSFAMNWGVKSLSVSVQGGYLKNNSNDSYYQFDNYFGSLGLEFKLK